MKMDTRHIRNHPLLPPILISSISLLGICLILGFAWIPRQSDAPPPTQTLTPFKYLLLATETFTSEPEMVTPDEPLPGPTATSAVGMQQASTSNGELSLASNGDTNISTDEDFFIPTVTMTPNPIFDVSDPMKVGKYDDIDSEIIRIGNWASEQNVEIAYQKTLLVSNTVGNYVAFSFIGKEMVLGYQTSDDAGDILVNIDSSEVTITQLVGNAWFSQELEPGIHFVILTHQSGASVNLDYIDIPS